ncbi:putative Peptidyl-prolyl cis-trans isomerase-like 2-like protein, partial [Naja naja]
GKYHCPVLFTVFTNNSHIVAIKTTGNVFGFEAVEQLNIKTKTFKDLLSDEPFSRQDIITLQMTKKPAAIDDDVVRYRYVKKKGYVRLHTSQGNLNLELHCDMVRSELARYSWLPSLQM